jgi:ATP-binding cassette subfamily F protein 3
MTFSGGEKSRLVLALLAWQRPHLLLLDEPTNHLDLDMRDALMLALEEYTGSVILVSHDRTLIRAVADEFWLIADGQAQLFDGDLEDYKNWIENQRTYKAIKPKPEKVTQPKTPKPNRKALLSKQTKLEGTLSIAQTELAAIHHRLADPVTYTNCTHEEISQLNHIRTELERKIAELEESWLELEAAMEECGQI